MDLREQSIVGCFPEFVFQFSVAQVLVGLRMQFMNNFVFSTWACAAGFNNNRIIRKMLPELRVIRNTNTLRYCKYATR